MKKIFFAFVLLLTSVVSANAMSYEQARDQALFLTDKMAYELDLSEEQYEAAFEINLDYLMGVNTASDVYADYWTRRNLDLSYVLLDWQYRTFCGLDYFYRPIYWGDGFWHFRIYGYYPHRDYLYFGRPHIYLHYHGGHAWHLNGGRSWYYGRTFHHGGICMRGGWDRGGYRHMDRGWRSGDGAHRGFDRGGIHGGSHNRGGRISSGSRPGIGNGSNSGSGYNRGSRGNSGMDRGNRGTNGSRSIEGSRPSSTRTTVGERSHSSSGSYTPSRQFSGGSRPSSSYSSGSSSSRSFSGGGSSSHSFSGGGSRSAGGSFGGGHSGGGHFGGGHSGGRR